MLFNFFYTLFRRKCLIIWVFSVTFLSMMFGTYLVTPLWKATAKILVEPNPRQQIVLFDRLTIPQGEISGVNPALNLIELLTSRSMAEEVVREFGLDVLAEKKAKEPEKLRDKIKMAMVNVLINYPIDFLTWLGILPPGEKNFLADAVDDFMDETEDIELEEDTSVIYLGIWGESPQMATDIANRMAEKLQEKLLHLTRGEAERAYEFVKLQVADAGKRLAELEEELRQFQEENALVMIDEQKKKVVERLAELETELNLTRISREETEERIKEVARQLQDENQMLVVSSVLAQNPQINELKNTLKDLEVRLASLLTERLETHPDVLGVKASIQEVKKRLKGELTMILQSETKALSPFYQDLTSRLISLKVDSFGLQAKEAGLAKAVAELKQKELSSFPAKERELARLTREVLIQEDVYRNLKAKLEALKVLKDTVINEVQLKIIDEAFVYPEADQDWPLWLLNIPVGLILSGAWALGLAFFVEYWNESFRTVTELKKKVQRLVLGSVPFVRKTGKKRAADEAAWTEAVHELAKNLLGLAKRNGDRIFILSGISPGGGTSTLALGLAKALAELGVRVLLVEAGLKRPVLASWLGLTGAAGLSDYLLGAATGQGVVQECAPNFRVITAGTTPGDKRCVLLSEKMAELLRADRTGGELVLLDAQTASSADTLQLSLVADGVVLLVEAEKDTREDVKAALERLEVFGSKVAGLVLCKERRVIPGFIGCRLNL